jgi:hypothetical protein
VRPIAFRQRYAMRDPIAYAVEAPEGEIGFVTGTRIAPFESLRRSVPRPPFPGERKRRPFGAGAAAATLLGDRPLGAASEGRTPSSSRRSRATTGCALAAGRWARSGYAALWMRLAPDSARAAAPEL